MKLEQFKEIADENLRDLYVDERMVSRIHRKLCAVPVRRKARVPRASALLAAACVVVMLLSGGVLLHGTGLLQPAAEMASHMGRLHFIPIVCGLMAGAAFLMGLDHLLPHLHIRQKQQEGLSTSWRRSVLLVTAMALHHIPEGLTMGVGYGAVAAGSTLPSGVALEMSSAFMVTGTTLLQNLPEGLVVATALRAEGFSAKRSWLCGVFSGCTAPIGAILGAVASQVAGSLLPFALAAAAGAMIYVVIEEVIPEANASGNGNAATVACIGGLCLVMSFSSLVG